MISSNYILGDIIPKMEIERQKEIFHKKYLEIKNIFCPYIESDVVFNSNGFRHLIYASGDKRRNDNSIDMRLKLVTSAKKLLECTTTLQEYFEDTVELHTKVHNKPAIVKKKIIYWGFIGIIDNKWKIKVVVKKVGNGIPFFWSVIPNWVTSKKRDQKFMITHIGDLEKD